LGRKTGRGFYTYAAPGSSEVVADDLTPAPAGSPDGAAAGRSAGTSRSVENVGVVGGGVVAGRIAEAFAGAGFTVVTASGAGGLDDLAGADLVVDTVGDDPGAKTDVSAALDAVCKPGTVLATTSASAPVIGYAMASGRPDDVVGLHFVTPGLVEVVRTVRTSPAAFATAGEVVRRLGAHPVACGDRAGFVVEALWYPYLNDAVRMLEAGYATVDDIDAAMTLGCGYPQGPFAALDSVGLDVALAAQRRIYHETREPGLAPAPLLEHLVTAGHLGRSAGRGFRDHTGRQPSGA
ncbi:MAG TPA: 3-hydroxyacyl-CoA dehydrogenase family protein, partial [Rugosimonospora sp.]|nr:3-hydroxyacyl-CoA dehydrogenase family protein [Rugosimonospora sp.]